MDQENERHRQFQLVMKMTMCTHMERIDLIFHHVQNLLTDISPTIYDFLKYREKIIISGPNSDLKEILANESDLSTERSALIERVQKERFNEKKKDFAVARAKLAVIDKKLKETTKNLNRRLTESDYVNVNLQKMGDDIAWMKQRLDMKEISAIVLFDQQQHPDHCSTRRSDLSTTIQKKEKIVVLERTLCSRIKALKDEQEQVMQEENSLRALRMEVENLDGQLTTLQNGNDPELLKRRREMVVKNESTRRRHNQEKELMQYQIDDLEDQLVKEENTHMKANEFLQNEILRLENHAAIDRDAYTKEIRHLDTEIEQFSKIREDNLKELLQLRVRWQTIEKRRKQIIQEKERAKAEKELETKRQVAGEIIQKKIRTLYQAKFQKKKATKASKKNKKKGKKKK